MNKYICTICGFIYDEAIGFLSEGIAPGTKWRELLDDWVCPLCKASKSEFKLQSGEEEIKKEVSSIQEYHGDLNGFTIGQLSALCSNLSRGCEKQYLNEEEALFKQLSDYFKLRTPNIEELDIDKLIKLVNIDLEYGFVQSNNIVKSKNDRGAQRALVWSEKVTRIINSILARYEKEGNNFLEASNIYLCEICGFIYVGEEPPELCPVCKVPNWKFERI